MIFLTMTITVLKSRSRKHFFKNVESMKTLDASILWKAMTNAFFPSFKPNPDYQSVVPTPSKSMAKLPVLLAIEPEAEMVSEIFLLAVLAARFSPLIQSINNKSKAFPLYIQMSCTHSG